jgi:hypothetical protein
MSDKWRRLLPQGNQEWLVTFGIQAATQVVMAGIFAYRGSYWLTAWSLVLTLVCLFFMRHIARKITKPQVVKPSYLNEPSPLGESWLGQTQRAVFGTPIHIDNGVPDGHADGINTKKRKATRLNLHTGEEIDVSHLYFPRPRTEEDGDRDFLEHLKPGCTQKGEK